MTRSAIALILYLVMMVHRYYIRLFSNYLRCQRQGRLSSPGFQENGRQPPLPWHCEACWARSTRLLRIHIFSVVVSLKDHFIRKSCSVPKIDFEIVTCLIYWSQAQQRGRIAPQEIPHLIVGV